MSIQRRESAGIVVLDVAGEYFGGLETHALEQTLGDEIAAGNVLLLLDLSSCRAMNSTALGILIEAHRACEAQGGVIKVCGARGRMKALLRVLHVERLFEQYETSAEALASFVQRASA
jgi:anti-anti-sigma factor